MRASPPPYVIGLTGGIGSGKSTVADLFAAAGVAIVDTDIIAHELTAPGGAAMPALIAAFGDGIAAADGRMDRAAMRGLVFGDPAARQRLEAILHPMIRTLTDERLATATSPYAIAAIPLLVEGGVSPPLDDPPPGRRRRDRFDRILVVDVPVEVQIERVMRRNGMTREQVLAIMAAQASREQRLAAADDVIDNGGDTSTLPAAVQALHRRYLREADARRGLSSAADSDTIGRNSAPLPPGPRAR